MLGELIAEYEGNILNQRVIPSDNPAIETTIQNRGKLLDMDATDLLTYCSVIRPDGTIFGEGQGITMVDGEMATWFGQGVGKFVGKGPAVSFRGAVYFQSRSEKLSCLNCIAVIFEFDSDDNGVTHEKLWEWK